MATPIESDKMDALGNFYASFRKNYYSPTTVNISEIILALIFRSRGASLTEQRKKRAIDNFIG